MELFFPFFTAFFLNGEPVTVKAEQVEANGFATYEECMAFNMKHVAEYSYEMAVLFNQPAQGYMTDCEAVVIGEPA